MKGETFLTYEVALLEPSICTKTNSVSILHENMVEDLPESSSMPVNEIMPAIITEVVDESPVIPELIKDVTPIDNNDIQPIHEDGLPQVIEHQKIEPQKKEVPKVTKKELTPIKPKSKPIPIIKKTETPQKEIIKPIENTEQNVSLLPANKIKNGVNENDVGQNSPKMSQNASLGNSENALPIMPIEKAKLRKKLPLPDYPKRAFDMGLEGEVTLQVLIDKSSYIKDIKIIRHKGNALFCTSAINTIKKEWSGLIEPHQQNGQFIEGWVEITIPFTIKRE